MWLSIGRARPSLSGGPKWMSCAVVISSHALVLASFLFLFLGEETNKFRIKARLSLIDIHVKILEDKEVIEEDDTSGGAGVAEMMEEYMVLLARILEHMFHSAPFPRRVRFLILRNLPFVTTYPLPIPPPPPPLIGAPAA